MREDVRNRIEMLDSIVASLKDYPNFGGDIGVMKEVERLRREAKIEVLDWAIKTYLTYTPGASGSSCHAILEYEVNALKRKA